MKRLFLILTLIATTLVGGYSLFAAYQSARLKTHLTPHWLAVVGPMTGKSADKGRAMVAGARLYAEHYNASLGEGERPILIAPYDDRNSPESAARVAREIVAEERVVAVLGHRSSAASLRAAPIYAEYGVPMVGATATAPMITKENPWAFRVVPDNDLQGRFIAHYIKANHYPSASVVFDRDAYGRSLAEAFEVAARELGLPIKQRIGFDAEAPSLEVDLGVAVERLSEDEPGMIFVAAHDREGAQLVRAVRDAGHDWPMIGNASLGKQSFPWRFAGLKEELARPGHYTNGLFAVSSLIFDVAGEAAQHFRERYLDEEGQEPDAAAAAYHDAAQVVAEALTRSGGGQERGRGAAARKAVRDALAKMSEPGHGVRGVTGLIHFDDEGDVVKSIPVGRYSGGRLVSAPLLLSRVEDFDTLTEAAEEEGFIQRLGGEPFHITHVVYTGIEPRGVSAFDADTLTFEVEFLLWFRSSAAVEPEEIEFLNAVEAVELGESIQEVDDGETEYHLYRVKGRFFAEAREGRDAFGEYSLGIRFRHRSIPESNLIYVADSVGMGGDDTPWARRLADHHLFEEVGDWSIKRAVLFQDRVTKSIYGHPDLVEGGREQRAFSRFNFDMAVEENHLSLRGYLPESAQHWILAISLIALCALMLAEEAGRIGICRRLVWLVEVILGVCVLAAAEPVLLAQLAEQVERFHLRMTSFAFDLLWWLYLAYALAKAVRLFIWDRLEVRTGQHVPNIARHLSSLFIYLLALYGIVAFVLKKDPTSLLATSGLVAMILGLALQSNLVNVFSGIAISLEKPFKIGDRIKMNFDAGPVVGRVIDMNWRSTKIRTGEETVVSMPNGTLANANINNLSTSAEREAESVSVEIDRRFDPAEVVERLRHAVAEIQGATHVAVAVEAFLPESLAYRIEIAHATADDARIINDAWHQVWRVVSELEAAATPA